MARRVARVATVTFLFRGRTWHPHWASSENTARRERNMRWVICPCALCGKAIGWDRCFVDVWQIESEDAMPTPEAMHKSCARRPDVAAAKQSRKAVHARQLSDWSAHRAEGAALMERHKAEWAALRASESVKPPGPVALLGHSKPVDDPAHEPANLDA